MAAQINSGTSSIFDKVASRRLTSWPRTQLTRVTRFIYRMRALGCPRNRCAQVRLERGNLLLDFLQLGDEKAGIRCRLRLRFFNSTISVTKSISYRILVSRTYSTSRFSSLGPWVSLGVGCGALASLPEAVGTRHNSLWPRLTQLEHGSLPSQRTFRCLQGKQERMPRVLRLFLSSSRTTAVS